MAKKLLVLCILAFSAISVIDDTLSQLQLSPEWVQTTVFAENTDKNSFSDTELLQATEINSPSESSANNQTASTEDSSDYKADSSLGSQSAGDSVQNPSINTNSSQASAPENNLNPPIELPPSESDEFLSSLEENSANNPTKNESFISEASISTLFSNSSSSKQFSTSEYSSAGNSFNSGTDENPHDASSDKASNSSLSSDFDYSSLLDDEGKTYIDDSYYSSPESESKQTQAPITYNIIITPSAIAQVAKIVSNYQANANNPTSESSQSNTSESLASGTSNQSSSPQTSNNTSNSSTSNNSELYLLILQSESADSGLNSTESPSEDSLNSSQSSILPPESPSEDSLNSSQSSILPPESSLLTSNSSIDTSEPDSTLLPTSISSQTDSSPSNSMSSNTISSQTQQLLSTSPSPTEELLSETFSYQTTYSKFTLQIEKELINLQLTTVYQSISDMEKFLGLSNTCEQETNCAACTLNSFCVWCPSENLCVEGDETGPEDLECEVFDYQECSAVDCNAYMSCSLCINNEECGWCESSQLCDMSTATGFNGDTCGAQEFYHLLSDSKNYCPADGTSPEFVKLARLQNQAGVLRKEIKELGETLERLQVLENQFRGFLQMGFSD